MASRSVLPEEELSCPVCYKVFVDPVLLSCSHSFCKACLEQWWRENLLRECPLCKRRSSRSDPPRNLVLKNLCEAFLGDGAQRASVCSLHSEKLQLYCLDHQEPVCVVCLHSDQHRKHRFKPIDEAAQCYKAQVKTSLGALQERLEYLTMYKYDCQSTITQIEGQAQEAERQINEKFKKLQQVLLKEQEARIHGLKKEVMSNIQMMNEDMEGLDREIEALSDIIKAVEMDLRAEDVSFLQNYKTTARKAQCSLSQDSQLHMHSLLDVAKYLDNQNLTYQVEDLQEQLASAHLGSVNHIGVRKLYLRYACQLTLDPNTANILLCLSERNKKVRLTLKRQPYPDHPERFDSWCIVLCREGLTGRCYWEVDWEGWVDIGATYRGIGRKGSGNDCSFGRNDKSWSLECYNKGYTAWHNNKPTFISRSSSSVLVPNRIGVYLDCPAGTLSYYTVSSDKLTHIHTFYCTFTEALYPALGPAFRSWAFIR